VGLEISNRSKEKRDLSLQYMEQTTVIRPKGRQEIDQRPGKKTNETKKREDENEDLKQAEIKDPARW